MKNLDKLIPPLNMDLKLNYDLTSQQKRIVLTLSGRSFFINQIMSYTGYDFEKSRRAMKSLVQYGLVDTELYQCKTRFKLSKAGENIVSTLIKLEVLHANGVNNTTKLPISQFKFNILKRLKDEPLAFEQLQYMLTEPPDQILNSLKYLQVLDLVLVESHDSYVDGKKTWISLYSLTPKGLDIVTHVLNTKATLDLSKKAYINGIEFGSKKLLLKHLAAILSTYKEGNFLLSEHQKVIIDCLRSTDWGLKLVPTIFKVKVVTNTDCIALIKNDNSEQIIRVHGILDGWSKYHKDEVRFAFRGELVQFYTPAEGLSRFHDGLTFKDIMSNFMDSQHLSFENIEIFRDDGHIRLVDRTLASEWVKYHNKHAKILLLTDDEMHKRVAIINTVSECQAEFDKYNAGNLGRVSI